MCSQRIQLLWENNVNQILRRRSWIEQAQDKGQDDHILLLLEFKFKKFKFFSATMYLFVVRFFFSLKKLHAIQF